MNEKLKAAIAKMNAAMTEQKGLLAKDEPSADEKARIAALDAELDTLEAEAKDAKANIEREQKAASRSAWLNEPANALPVGDGAPAGETKVATTPAIPRGVGKATSFKSDTHAGGRSAQEKAHRFGMFALAGLFKSERAIAYCREHGIEVKAASEGRLTAGGVLVPPEFDAELIDLREQFGIARMLCRVKGMSSDTRDVPRRTGGLTAYPIGEGETITDSDKAWDLVSLVAKKWGVLCYISSELDEDAVIDVGNDLASEIAYAFAVKEDDCLLNGDGTSTYHGIVGVRPKILGLSATRANIAGLIVGAGNLYSELVLSDFEAVVGRLPQYADTPNTRWVTHRSFYWNVMIKLMLASGGVTEAEVSRQGRNVPFLGYPVQISQKMPSAEANDQVCALFGDFAQGVMFGDRRVTTIAVSEHKNFAEDQVAIRGTERFDINCHDLGNASGTAALRVPGPIVGLLTAAS